MTDRPYLTFNDGLRVPQLGYGTYKISDDRGERSVLAAFEAGYRHIDTARFYHNESAVGRAVAGSGLKRGDIFVTTKLWQSHQGRDSTREAFLASLDDLGLDYVDLYLIHWPAPALDKYVESFETMMTLRDEGLIKSLGVAHFLPDHLDRLIAETGATPALNQIELHPYFQQKTLRDYHRSKGIVTETWSPIGQGTVPHDPVLAEIGERHGKTGAQVALRWHLQLGLLPLPKSATPARIRENFDLFDFELSTADMALIEGLDKLNGRIGPDPASFS